MNRFFVFGWWILNIAACITAIAVAKKKGRLTVWWVIFCLVFPPGALLILWLIDSKTEVPADTSTRQPDTSGDPPPAIGLRYRHTYDGYGIAVDPEKRVIHLKSFRGTKAVTATYPFSDVREWRFNIPSTGGEIIPGHVVGGGLEGFGHNLGSAVRASVLNHKAKKATEEATGLFILVRDIDMPEWQIKFPNSRSREMEIKRWMEILRQHINESA